MREVTGTFFCLEKLGEALEELSGAGIVQDRVRFVSEEAVSREPAEAPCTALHWRSAEYAGHGEHLGVVDVHDDLFASVEDDLSPGAGDGFGEHGATVITVSVRDDRELRSVWEIFSRLGSVDLDLDAEMLAA
jgi:hypothetical protein